jgi:hypothetical protein
MQVKPGMLWLLTKRSSTKNNLQLRRATRLFWQHNAGMMADLFLSIAGRPCLRRRARSAVAETIRTIDCSADPNEEFRAFRRLMIRGILDRYRSRSAGHLTALGSAETPA